MGVVLCILLLPALAWSAPPGTVISNTAQATYTLGATAGIVSPSNTVETTTVIVRTPSALEFLQYAPTLPGAEMVSVPVTECSSTGTTAGPFVPLSPPIPCGSGTPIDIGNPVPLVATNVYHQGDPIFILMTDHDQNLDALEADKVLVSLENASLGENELLRLTETGTDTGVFVGYIQSQCTIPATEHNGICTVDTESLVVSRYTDSSDGTDTATVTVMVDPYGIVFDSSTGLPVDGAQVTLNDARGDPAQVFGEDGLSTFPATVTSGGTATDSGGKTYDFPPGGYRFPFVTPGTYRLDVVPPSGYDAPSQIPTGTLQTLPGAPFAIVEPGSRGEEFILNPGPAFDIDLPVDPVVTSLWVTKSASQDTASIGDFLQYTVNVQNTMAGVMSAVTLTDLLPLGFRYQPGSLKIDGIASPDPAISSDGDILTLFLGDLAGTTTKTVRYVVEVTAGTRSGNATNKAFAEAGGGITSNVARARVRVKEELFRSRCFIMGQVIADNCDDMPAEKRDGLKGVRIYLEDGTYVITDKRGMFHFEGLRPGVHVVQLDLDSLPEEYEVVSCEENSRFAGRSFSQFVDLQGGTMWRTDFHVALKPEGAALVETTGPLPADGEKTAGAEAKKPETIGDFDTAWIESAEPGLEWLWPGPEYSPPIPSCKLAFKHDPTDILKLLLDGSEVSSLNFESTQKNKSGTVAVSRWRGVDLREGDNRFELIVHDTTGKKIGHLKRLIHYSGPPVHVEVVEEQSNLRADGRQTPVIAIRLTDKDGYPLREGMIGTFSVDPPYAAEEELDALRKNPLSGMGKEKPHYIVSKNGVALLRLQATSRSGETLVRIPLADDHEEELRVWLKPEARDWILVGLAEGTVGYNTVEGHMENAGDADVDDHLYDDGRIAFFAKGKIKGEWLLTMAYDNKKTREEVGNSLHQTIDPDTYYTLYGDETEQHSDAASARKLYLKIERDQFYALFGDYDTGLTVTELSRYSRSLNGFKSEMKAENFSYSFFVSETSQAFVKDEIRGDGTSGLYHLSRKNIVINSEKIVIETRDRFRSEVVVSTRALTRHRDYNIDYDAGTLFFREPIYSKDENLNPVFIVVDYESFDGTDEEYTYGGRGAVKLMDDTLEVGATYVHEGPTGARADLGGVDATVEIGRNTELRAEFATSERIEKGSETKGDAYLAELAHRSGPFDGQLYVKEQGTGFGLGQQKGSETGTRKIGGDAAYRITKKFTARGEAYRNFNLATDAERDLGEATVQYSDTQNTVHTGFRHAEDRFVDGTVNRSDQLTAGASRRLFHNRLQVRVDREQSLGSNDDNPDFPTRTILGVDYRLTQSVSLFGEHELTQGENGDTQGTRLGMKTTPWSGGEVNTSVERQLNEYGPRTFANLGLNQTLNLSEKWSIDGGLDHSRTVEKPDAVPFNVNVPSASGVDYDFTAVSLGTTYKETSWSWASRVEFRFAENEDKWGVATGVYSEPISGIGLSAGIQLFRTEAERGADTTDADIRFGLAYRPKKTRWIILDRLDLKVDKQEDSTNSFENWRIVNNMNANFKPDHKTQISFQYGMKYVGDTIDGDSYSGYTDLMGVEGRYDLTKQWDVGLRARVLHSWRSAVIDYSSGLSTGYNVVENAWVSVGYNFMGFEDEDFSRADFTAQGPFVQFRFKFDQESVEGALKEFASYRDYGGRDPGKIRSTTTNPDQ
jgi:uncharacterized repeat protein (TIGR01451 family)